ARAELISQISLTTVSTAVGLGAWGAGMLGAGVASTFLGALAVPLAGIAIGVPGIVSNIEARYEKAMSTYRQFDNWYQSVLHPDFQRQQSGVWALNPYAVIDEIDFRGGTLRYSSNLRATAFRGQGHRHVDCDWEYTAQSMDSTWGTELGSGRFYEDVAARFDVYEALGLSDKTRDMSNDLKNGAQASFILPSQPARLVRLHGIQYANISASEAPAYAVMHRNYTQKAIRENLNYNFDWAQFVDLICHWSVAEGEPPYGHVVYKTPVMVKLDGRDRVMIVPHILDGAIRSHLAYELHGNGGQYALILSPWAIEINVHADNTAQADSWVIDITAQARTLTNRTELEAGKQGEDTFKFGDPAAGAFDRIQVGGALVVVGSQTLNFTNAPSASPVLVYRETDLTLQVVVDLARQHKQAVFTLPSWPPSAESTSRINSLLQGNSSLKTGEGVLLQQGQQIWQYNPLNGKLVTRHGEDILASYQWNPATRSLILESLTITDNTGLLPWCDVADLTGYASQVAWQRLVDRPFATIGNVQLGDDFVLVKQNAMQQGFVLHYAPGAPKENQITLTSLTWMDENGTAYQYTPSLGVVAVVTADATHFRAPILGQYQLITNRKLTLMLDSNTRTVDLRYLSEPASIVLPEVINEGIELDLGEWGLDPSHWHLNAEGELWAGPIGRPALRLLMDSDSMTLQQMLERVTIKQRGSSGVQESRTLHQIIAPLAIDSGHRLFGTNGNDRLQGGGGDDALYGFYGADTLLGGMGNDFLDGEAGVDSLNGGEGDDMLIGGSGADTLDGGEGVDTVSYAASQDGIMVCLDEVWPQRNPEDTFDEVVIFQKKGDAQGDVLINIENVYGSDFDDSLIGNHGDNELSGGMGNDTLNGGAGSDTLFGGDGADTMEGGAGDDTLFGDGGADTYVFDFTDGGHDRIDAGVAGASKQDTLKLIGIGVAELEWLREEQDLVIRRKGSRDHSVRVERHFGGEGALIDRIVFADDDNKVYDGNDIRVELLKQGISSMPLSPDGQLVSRSVNAGSTANVATLVPNGGS
ncbi:TcdA/TcdB pore-forming domain-containing protein, partial [Chromobacterium piscinae]